MLPGDAEHTKAVVALVMGILSCVACFFGVCAIIGVALGIIGIVFSRKATAAGNIEGINKAGFILSIIGLCLSGVIFIISAFVIGSFAAAGILL